MEAIGRRKGSSDVIALEPLDRDWKNLFSRYDLDNDGRIEVHEFIRLLEAESNRSIPPSLIQHLRRSLTKGGGATYITYSDFIQLINDRQPKSPFQRVFFQYIKHTIPPRVKHVDWTDGDYEDEYSCTPPAVGMLIASIIEISLFLYDELSGPPNAKLGFLGPLGMELYYTPERRIEAWRFITYMFVHSGIFHLGVNVVVQILLGIPLEMVHGWWRVLIVYFAGVLGGSLGTSVSDPYVSLVGASGGVYAIITAHVATIIMNWSEMRFAWGQLLIFLFITVTDLGTAIYNRYTKVDDKIGYTAHLAGALSGLLVGLYILRNLEVHSWEKKISWIALVTFLTLITSMIVFNIMNPSYFPKQDTSW